MALLKNVETSWNFVLADKEGNISYQMSGLMPRRRIGISSFVPLPVWEKKNDWQGFENPDMAISGASGGSFRPYSVEPSPITHLEQVYDPCH